MAKTMTKVAQTESDRYFESLVSQTREGEKSQHDDHEGEDHPQQRGAA